MPETTPLQPLAPWVSLASTDADSGVLDTMLAQLHLVRTFEEEVRPAGAQDTARKWSVAALDTRVPGSRAGRP